MHVKPAPALFSTGPISCSQGALDALHQAGVYGFWLVYRHMTGDWGDDKNLAAANRATLDNDDDGPVVSWYRLTGGFEIVITTIYVCTPAMRRTDICLADEVIEDEATKDVDDEFGRLAEAAMVEETPTYAAG